MLALSDPLDFGPIWAAVPGTTMKRVNQMRLYRLGNLTRLRSLKPCSNSEFVNETSVLAIQLKAFVDNIEYQQAMPAAVGRAREFYDELRKIYGSTTAVSGSHIALLEYSLQRFETSLDDDLARLPTYIVEPVGAYSSDMLISYADAIFPLLLRDGAIIPPQAIEDFRFAGKCLAFDVPTACGFHVFRATDAMLRKYCDHFGAVLKGTGRDWGRYIQALKDVLAAQTAPKKPNVRTVELLDSIRANDRNPLIHPEQNLDSDEALAAFDLCKNAVLLMALDIKKSL
jgi:hypothetical protein